MTNNITDVQGQKDSRDLEINKVGITGMAIRAYINLGQEKVYFQGKANCFVFLDAEKKGTHMSRMARGLTQLIDQDISVENIEKISLELYKNLETTDLYIELNGECIRKKVSPITKFVGYEQFEVSFKIEVKESICNVLASIAIIGTSLCPASKTNSKYGAHNQRSKVTINFNYTNNSDFSKYVSAVEENLSSNVYPILKLDDEAFVTEKAYENPKFVEDIVRDVVTYLNKNKLSFYSVECENFESIHTHNAYAIIIND